MLRIRSRLGIPGVSRADPKQKKGGPRDLLPTDNEHAHRAEVDMGAGDFLRSRSSGSRGHSRKSELN